MFTSSGVPGFRGGGGKKNPCTGVHGREGFDVGVLPPAVVGLWCYVGWKWGEWFGGWVDVS